MSQTAVNIFLVSLMVGLVVGETHLQLDDDYDKNLLPPSPNGAPLDISGVMNLRNILEVEQQMQQITLEVTLRFFWKDSRVRVKKGVLRGTEEYLVLVKNEDYEKLWLPDIFIDQAIDIRNPRYLIDPSSVRIYGDGMVSYAQRMNFDVTCNMDFRKFPFDNQTCDIIFHSFAYTTDDYTLRWMKKADGSVNSYTNHDIHLAQWRFDYSFDDEYDMAEIGDEVKPGLIATLTFQRLPFYHILMFYLPALLFSILAYLTSFIPPVYGIGLRSGVNIVILLSIFALNNGVKSSMPLVSYATFIDIWMFACFLVVFFALFEHSLLFIFISMRRVAAAKTIEVFSRFFIPIAFLLFVVVYIVLYFFL